MAQELRPLTIDDYDMILALWADAGLPYKPFGRDSREMMSAEMQLDHCAYFGFFEDGQMLAVGIGNYDGRRGWVNRVAVHPDRRGEKLAAKIIDRCEEFLRSRGAVVICALIEDINFPSISCFTKQGYKLEKPFHYFAKRDSDEA